MIRQEALCADQAHSGVWGEAGHRPSGGSRIEGEREENLARGQPLDLVIQRERKERRERKEGAEATESLSPNRPGKRPSWVRR